MTFPITATSIHNTEHLPISIAWLLKFVAGHSIGRFVPYRVGLGVLLLIALGTGVLSAT